MGVGWIHRGELGCGRGEGVGGESSGGSEVGVGCEVWGGGG